MASKFSDIDKLLLSRTDQTYTFTYKDLIEGLEEDLDFAVGNDLETVTKAGNKTTQGILVLNSGLNTCVTLSNDTSVPSIFIHKVQAGETETGDDDNTVVTLGYLKEQLENLDLDDVLIYQGTIDFSKTDVASLGQIETGYVWAHMATDVDGDYDPSVGPIAPDPSWNLGFDTSSQSSTADASPIPLVTVADGELIGLGNSFFGKLGSSSVDIGYELSGGVDETVGGTVLDVEVTTPGDSFIAGVKYTAFIDLTDNSIEFTPLQVGSSGELVNAQIKVNSSAGTFADGSVLTAQAIQNDGTVATVAFSKDQDPGRLEGTFEICQLNTSDDPSSGISVDGTFVKITTPNTADPATFTVEIVDQGYGGFVGAKQAYIKNVDLSGQLIITEAGKLDITTKDAGSGAGAELTVTDLADGADTDKAVIKLTDQDNNETQVTIRPGRGIKFINTDTNEFEIQNTIDIPTDDDDTPPTTSSAVFVSPSAPELGEYPIVNGSLWYNTVNGRLYVAVTYYAGTDVYFDWIDASPSSFNDAIRKNQNDATDNTLDVNNTFYAQHFNLERLDPMPPVSP